MKQQPYFYFENCWLTDPKWSGRRDRVFLETMYNTGARVSEMISTRVSDIRFEAPAQILLHGKGRKERAIPLWKSTAKLLRDWIRENNLSPDHHLFPASRGGAISRSGVAKRLQMAVEQASHKCPSLSRRPISPHTFRHTTAMHLLESGVDLVGISLWLGHESIETTNVYITSSLKSKEETLSKMASPAIPFKRFKANDELIAYLSGL